MRIVTRISSLTQIESRKHVDLQNILPSQHHSSGPVNLMEDYSDYIVIRDTFNEAHYALVVDGSGVATWVNGEVVLDTGVTINSYASILKSLHKMKTALSWDRASIYRIVFKVLVIDNLIIHCVVGDFDESAVANIMRHIGFKVDGSHLYGTVADGTTESTLSLLNPITHNTYYSAEVVYTPASKAIFKVDGVVIGEITTNLPSGTVDAHKFVNASIYNVNAAQHYFGLSVLECYQAP